MPFNEVQAHQSARLGHCAAMELLRNGVDCTAIALRLGRDSVETTQVYIHKNLQMNERERHGKNQARGCVGGTISAARQAHGLSQSPPIMPTCCVRRPKPSATLAVDAALSGCRHYGLSPGCRAVGGCPRTASAASRVRWPSAGWLPAVS